MGEKGTLKKKKSQNNDILLLATFFFLLVTFMCLFPLSFLEIPGPRIWPWAFPLAVGMPHVLTLGGRMAHIAGQCPLPQWN